MNYRLMPAMHKALFGASIAMFIISAITLGLIIQELNSDVVLIGNRQGQIILAVLQYILGDLIIIWRVWVVWGHAYLIIVGPLLILMAGAGFTLSVLHSPQGFFTMIPGILIVANTSICTLLIVGRIWYLHRKLSRSGNRAAVRGHYKGVIFLVVESGVLYTAAGIISLILNFRNSPALPIMLDLEVPLVGILPTLIIVLVHRGSLTTSTSSKNQFSSIVVQRSIRVHQEADGVSYPTSPNDADSIVMEPKNRMLQESDYKTPHPPLKREANLKFYPEDV